VAVGWWQRGGWWCGGWCGGGHLASRKFEVSLFVPTPHPISTRQPARLGAKKLRLRPVPSNLSEHDGLSLSLRNLTNSAFRRDLLASSIRHLYLHLCTASFLKCPRSASKPQTRTYAKKLYQPLAALKVKCIALLVLVTFLCCT
jgi:hypothetical protein